MKKVLFALIAGVASVATVAGCGALAGGETIVKFERGGEARMTTAPDNATYALRGSFDATAEVKYTLRKGDPLGFEKVGEEVFAVAGTNRTKVGTTMVGRNVYWKKTD